VTVASFTAFAMLLPFSQSPETSYSTIEQPVWLTPPKSAVAAALVGDAPAFATHTDTQCVVDNSLVLSVSFVQVTPWPVNVGSSGVAASEFSTNAISSEFAAGV
jgi:hypothetical protein